MENKKVKPKKQEQSFMDNVQIAPMLGVANSILIAGSYVSQSTTLDSLSNDLNTVNSNVNLLNIMVKQLQFKESSDFCVNKRDIECNHDSIEELKIENYKLNILIEILMKRMSIEESYDELLTEYFKNLSKTKSKKDSEFVKKYNKEFGSNDLNKYEEYKVVKKVNEDFYEEESPKTKLIN